MNNIEVARLTLLSALSSLKETHPSQASEIDRIASRVKDTSVDDDAIHNDMKRLRLEISQEKQRDEFSVQFLLEEVEKQIQNLIGSEKSTERQKALLEDINLSKSPTATDAILSLSVAVNVFAEEAINLRYKQGHTSEHQDDFGTPTHRQLIKSFTPILKDMIRDYPNDNDLQALHEQAVTIFEGDDVTVYDVVGLMEKTTRRIGIIQGRKKQSETQYLLAFHQHLKSMHDALNSSIGGNEIFANESDSERKNLESIMAKFKDVALNESDPLALKNMISENVKTMQESFSNIMEKQRTHISKQQETMLNLKKDVEQKVLECEELASSNEVLKEAFVKLERRSLTDELTGAPNRRAYDDKMKALSQSLSNMQHPKDISKHSIIVLDIDKFKYINDTFGHNIGDKVLKKVTEIVSSVIAEVDSSERFQLYRFGGEEFVIIGDGATLSMACGLAEIIRETLSKKRYSVKQQTLQVTASFGVAAFSHLNKAPSEVFKRADEAMYQAKEMGRNKVCYFANNALNQYSQKKAG